MSRMMRKVVECETEAEEGRKTNKVEEGGGPDSGEGKKMEKRQLTESSICGRSHVMARVVAGRGCEGEQAVVKSEIERRNGTFQH